MNRHVLFVDDDVKLLDGVTRRFETLFELQVASSGEEGLQKIRESGPFAVVVSDMRMPVMDGLQFIEQARGIAQETVFMMLTGNQDLLTASNAVNRGQVFRFLTKPCPSTALGSAVEDGIRQYELVTGQHELLHRTVCGSVTVLTELLELTHPKAMSRAHDVGVVLERAMEHLGIEDRWEYKLAARLANIGCVVTSQSDPGQSPACSCTAVISQAEAELGKRLIAHIPRLRTVAEIIGRHSTADGVFTDPTTGEQALITSGASIVRAAMEFEARVRQGIARNHAIREMVDEIPKLAPVLIDAFEQIDLSTGLDQSALQEVEVSPLGLSAEMVLARHAELSDGTLLLSAGTRLTKVFVEKLRHTAESSDMRPLFVYEAAGAMPVSPPTNPADGNRRRSD